VFVSGAVRILSEYPPEVTSRVVDPKTGIPDKQNWLPTLHEIRKACEAEAQHQETVKRYAAMGPPPRAAPRIDGPKQCRANLLVHKAAPRYGEMVARAEKHTDPLDWKWDEQGKGIWVPFFWYK
jgi:hypothetical protein